MRRRLFTIACGLSLALCLAVCVLWARSEFHSDRVTYRGWQHDYESVSQRGEIVLGTSYSTVQVAERCYQVMRGPSFADQVGRAEYLALLTQFDRERKPHWERGTGPGELQEYPLHGKALSFLRIGVIRHGWTSDVVQPGNWLVLPYWLIFMLTAIAPFIQIVRWRRRTLRTSSGHCICGYDLRATRDRCPECGRETKSTPAVESRYDVGG